MLCNFVDRRWRFTDASGAKKEIYIEGIQILSSNITASNVIHVSILVSAAFGNCYQCNSTQLHNRKKLQRDL